jgi:uncharacterized glyoxalase superfamily protein PhnB
MPSSTVIPVLGYRDVREAVTWLCRAFGFVERLRIGDHRAQLVVGDGSVVVTGLPGGGEAAGPPGSSVMVRVTGIDAHFERAAEAGAKVLSPPADYRYGERQYTVADPGGQVWTFSESVADIDPSDWGGELLTPPRSPRPR